MMRSRGKRTPVASPSPVRFYGSALLVALLFALLSAYVVLEVRATDYAAAGRATLNTARLVADNVEGSFEQLDALLKSIGRLYVDGLGSGPEDKTRLAEHMKKEIADYPIVARVQVIDQSGRLILRSGEYISGSSATSVSDRASFKRAEAGDRGLIFDGPVKSKFAPDQVIIVARRLEDANGAFLGVVSAGVPVEALGKSFSTLDYADRGVVALWTDGGVLVARYAKGPGAGGGVGGAIGADMLSARTKAQLGAHPEQDHDVYDFVSTIDGVARLFAYQKLAHAPFLVAAGQPKDALDQPWRRLAIELGLLCLAVTIGALWMARRLHASAVRLNGSNRQLEAKNRAMAASERKFRDVMACAPNAMAIFTEDGRIIDVNAATCDLLGYTRDELLAQDISSVIAPGEALRDPENMRRLKDGELKAYRVVRRYRHKDGRHIPLQVETSVAPNESEGDRYFIAQGHDISARLAYEERLKALLDTAVDGIYVNDLDGAIVEFSQSVVDMTGYSRDEIRTLNVAAIDAVERSEGELETLFRAAAQRGEPLTFDTKHRRKDGSVFDVEISARAIELSGKTYIYSAARDVSARKRAEAALAESRKLLQAVFDSSPYGAAMFDANLDCVLRNENYGRILDLPRDLLDRKPDRLIDQVWSFYDRGDFGYETSWKELVDQLFAEGGLRAARREERRLVNGRWIEMRFVPLDFGSLLVTCSDVTSYKTIENELRRTKERLETAAAAGVIGVWDWDLGSGVLFWDRVTQKIYGVKEGDFENARDACFALLHPEDRILFLETLWRAVESASDVVQDFRIVRPDGDVRRLRSFARPMRLPESKPMRMVGVTYDVTDETEALRALEEAKAQAEAANRAKSEFLANISHEIRTPLNAIVGMTELLARSARDEEQAGYVRTLDSSARSMLVLLTDLLDLSKIEAGQLELNEIPFSLAEVVGNVAETFGPSAKRKGLALNFEAPPDGLPTMLGDAIRLGQVLTNLVGNAIKFTLEGAVTISVEAVERSAESVRIRVTVRDTGIGIAPEHIGKLFQPFVQADGTTSIRFGGTGLGLAISKRLVGLMGGEIGVESEKGKGSAFWFAVAFKAAAEPAAKAARSADGHDGKRLDGVRILVVDDTETNREVAVKLLSLEGALCETAENGRVAIEFLRARASDFDCVLMDVQMPEMDGLEATRCLRRELGLADLPVIALTAGAMASQRELALASGMNGFVTKPFRLKGLVAALAPWIRRKAADETAVVAAIADRG